MGTLSGPATACVLRRQREVFGDARFERLGSISVAHMYNLRHEAGYRAQRVVLTKTHGNRATAIGVRKAPTPEGRPGFIRIDSVHQDDFDGIKGLFEILGFHANNGSEYVNHRVAKMLDKLRVEFTRSRPRRSNDNGLVETKNGAVVRKLFGYAHIAQRHARDFNTFCVEHLNPFLNWHRPCLFATEVADTNKPGRIKRVYRPKGVMTPLDKLSSLPAAAKCLPAGVTLQELQQLARALSDVQAAEELNEARAALFRRVPTRTG